MNSRHTEYEVESRDFWPWINIRASEYKEYKQDTNHDSDVSYCTTFVTYVGSGGEPTEK